MTTISAFFLKIRTLSSSFLKWAGDSFTTPHLQLRAILINRGVRLLSVNYRFQQSSYPFTHFTQNIWNKHISVVINRMHWSSITVIPIYRKFYENIAIYQQLQIQVCYQKFIRAEKVFWNKGTSISSSSIAHKRKQGKILEYFLLNTLDAAF